MLTKGHIMCVCVRVRACVRACVRANVRACVRVCVCYNNCLFRTQIRWINLERLIGIFSYLELCCLDPSYTFPAVVDLYDFGSIHFTARHVCQTH